MAGKLDNLNSEPFTVSCSNTCDSFVAGKLGDPNPEPYFKMLSQCRDDVKKELGLENVSMYTRVCMHAYMMHNMYIYIYIYIYICIHIYSINVYMYKSMYVYVYVHIHVYMHTHIHI